LLKRYKLAVKRAHTDRGSMFINAHFVEFCLERGLRRAATVSDDKPANGRAAARIGVMTRLSRTRMVQSRHSYLPITGQMQYLVQVEGFG
jgi:hypothetical protein